MLNTRTFIVLFIVVLVGSLTTSSWPMLDTVYARAEQVPMSTEPVVNKDLIRNGQFNDYGQYGEPNGWGKSDLGGGVDPTGGQDGSPAMKMEGITLETVVLYQQLRLPSETTSATMDFQFRLFPKVPTYSSSAQFGAYLVAVTDSQGTLQTLATAGLSPVVDSDTGWQQVSYPLTPAEISQVQAAHTAGQPVYVYFQMGQGPANAFATYVDNVSFSVSGSTMLPTSAGSIAFVGSDAAGNPSTVNRIDPDGANRQTLWTHPSTVPQTNAIADVVWKPDATELAFSSNHEPGYSAFNSDLYGLKPDGSGLRRITNPPSKAELDAGGYQFGTVTGKVRNNYKSVTTFLLYVEGAKEPISVDVGEFNNEVGFTVPDVADLGVGLHYVVFIWSDANNANCREYAVGVVDAEPGKTVDAGTMTFNGTCGTYSSDSISWKGDGTQVAADVITPRKFLATGQAIGSDLFNAPLTANEVAWSPVNDQILYFSSTANTGTDGIYLTTVGGAAGTYLVQTGSALWVTPAWLPDGSGFVYTADHELRQHILNSSTDTLLASFGSEYVFNPSVSPDGKYIVFEWQTSAVPNLRDLWIVDRANPVQLWQLTDDGHSSDPDWSRKEPTNPGPTCTALAGVTISGPDAAETGSNTVFTANVNPSAATAPITYKWSPEPSSGQNTKQATYNWSSDGKKQISVEAGNCSGTAKAGDNHTVSVSKPSSTCTRLTAVSVAGTGLGSMGADYDFTAVVSPGNASTPIAYKWSPAPDSGQSTAKATYRWNDAGNKQISVEASNCSTTAKASDDHTVSIGSDSVQNVYLPAVVR
jgi:hypothetical protein